MSSSTTSAVAGTGSAQASAPVRVQRPVTRRITIDKLRVLASIGILAHELKARQPLLVTMIVDVNPGPLMPAHDSVDDVFDYRYLRLAALEEIERGHVNMIETLCARIAERVLAEPAIARVLVRIAKPNVFPDCDGVSVEVDVHRDPAPEVNS